MIELVGEFLAFWLGDTIRAEVARAGGAFRPGGYSLRSVTSLMQQGADRRGGSSVRYDRKAKRFTSDGPANRLHGVRRPADVMATLFAVRAWTRGGPAPFPCPVVSTASYRKQPDAEVFRTLLSACARRHSVDLLYRGRERERDTPIRFSPHTVVETAHRLHIRGYSRADDGGPGHYWDLVPSRVLRIEKGSPHDYVDASGDDDWNEAVTLQLCLHEDVAAQMRAAVMQEHDMVQDVLVVGPFPKALLHYVRSEYMNRTYVGYKGDLWQDMNKI